METFRPESLPPAGNYIFRAVIGNIVGDNFYNHIAEITLPEGKYIDLHTLQLC